jgi:hypothetical protein
MLKIRKALALAALGLLVGGCVTPPQPPVALAPDALSAAGGRVGVAMSALPKVETSFPGASCLLCLMFASAANSTLSTHTSTLTVEDLPKLKADTAEAIRRKGVEVVVIEENLSLNDLPSSDAKTPGFARKDHGALRQKYGIDKLLVINVTGLGIWRNYSAYIPTGDPKAVFVGMGYLVNLKTNAYEWYEPININRAADGSWDEPPKFPGLTNAYFQALEMGKDKILKPFSN